MDYKNKVSMVITGSIGLAPILRQIGLSATINQLKPFELKPWEEQIAVGCLEALANNYGIIFKEGVCELMIKKLGCNIPHHVQLYFDSIYEYCIMLNSMHCSKEIAKKVYKESMLSTKGHAELNHYEERIKMVLGKELFPFTLDILTETAVTGYLSKEAMDFYCNEIESGKDEVLRKVLSLLEHDGYLKHEKKGYVFISKLLQDWWKGSFGTYFIPAAKRRIK
ncbi:hypothetical protein HY745_05550 [Candidatus Desantisbacteria bacterium]|nr:hypothetical protein [Candidatus Desantisbacteria bacterium]